MTGDRKLVVTEHISANGVIEFLDPWFNPGDQTDADDLLGVMREQMAAEGALLLGRRTFEDFRGYWPLQTNDRTGSTAHLNRVPKYVLSSTLADPGWGNTTVLTGPLVDEVRLFVYPVRTSRGRNLVPDGLSMQGLTLRGSRPFRSGVVLLTYARA